MPYIASDVYTIYRYIAPDGKCYVGKTGIQQGDRAGPGGSGYKHCKRFWAAITEYGWEAFRYEILAVVEKDEEDSAQKACDLEKKYITQFQTTNPEYGFNTLSGDTPRTYERLAEARKNRRVINKDGVIKQVPGSEFESYISLGWKPGYNR